MQTLCLQDSYNVCFPKTEFYAFFSSLVTGAGQGFQKDYESPSTESSQLYYI